MKKYINLFIGVLFGFVLVGCSNNSSDNTVSAPTSIADKVYLFTYLLEDGSVDTNSADITLTVSSNERTYQRRGALSNTLFSQGTIKYSTENNKLSVSFFDTIDGKGKLTMTYVTDSSGTFIFDSFEANELNVWQGTFSELK